MSEEHRVKAVLSIGGEIGRSFHSSMNAVTGNITKIGTVANKAIKSQMGKAIKDAKAEAAKLNAEIKKTGDSTGKLGSALAKVSEQLSTLKGANQLYYNMGSAASKFAVGLATITAEATAAGWAMYHLTEGFEGYVKSARIGAKMNDMTPENFVRIKYMAGDEEKLDAFMKARALLSKANLTNSKQYQKALSMVGLSSKDLKGLTLTEGMFKIGDALKNYKGDKEGLAKVFFGRGGQQVMPILMRGSAENKARMAEADKLGLSVTDEDIAKNAEYAHQMERLQGSILGVKLSLGRALLPAVERLGNVATDFMVKNHDKIANWANRIGSAIEKLVPTSDQLSAGFTKLGNALDWAIGHPAILKDVFGAVVFLPFAPFVAALLSIGGSMAKIGGLGSAGGLISVATMSLGKLAATAVPLAALGVQLWIIAKGYQAIGDVMKEWSENKNILTDPSAWGAVGKTFLQTDPIAKRLLGPGTDADEIAKHRKGSLENRQGVGAGRKGTPAPQSTPSQTTNHNSITINLQPPSGMDMHGLARLVASTLDGRLAAAGAGALYD